MKSEEEWNKKIEDDLMNIKNEIFSRFWHKQYDRILFKHSYKDEFELESRAINNNFVNNIFSEKLLQIAKEYKMKLTIGKDKSTGKYYLQFPTEGLTKQYCSTIWIFVTGYEILFKIVPGVIETKVFHLFEYRTVLAIVSDLCAVDLSELIDSLKKMYAKYWINEKNAELAVESINTLCKNFLDKFGIHYLLQSYALSSVISYENRQHQRIQKTIIHNEFNENPGEIMTYIQSIKKDWEK